MLQGLVADFEGGLDVKRSTTRGSERRIHLSFAVATFFKIFMAYSMPRSCPCVLRTTQTLAKVPLPITERRSKLPRSTRSSGCAVRFAAETTTRNETVVAPERRPGASVRPRTPTQATHTSSQCASARNRNERGAKKGKKGLFPFFKGMGVLGWIASSCGTISTWPRLRAIFILRLMQT